MPSSYPVIDDSGDTHQLIQPDHDSDHVVPCYKRHRWCLGLLFVLFLILMGHGLAIYFIYIRCNADNGCMKVTMMALNTWGMPAFFGSKFKTERMKAIADVVKEGEFDIYLFEELWMQPDHTTIANAVPKGYYMTQFRELALATCDGRVAPTDCSGLAIATKFPIQEIRFDSYTYHGDVFKAAIDGEWLARKGIGRVQIVPMEGVVVDVYVTHTAADPDPIHGYNNSYYRVKQVHELMNSYVRKSKADVVLLGGDFNAPPVFKEGEPYQMIRDYMTNCVEELYYKLKQWLQPKFATYGNQANTFSRQFGPIIYDYIFHKSNTDDISVYTNWFELPLFKTLLNRTESISLSDHEAVTSTIYIRKYQ